MINTPETSNSMSIRTVAITLIVFSALVIVSNGMGAVVSVMLDFDKMVFSAKDSQTMMAFIMEHYFQLCLFMVGLGAVYLIGGIFLLRHKLWANRLVMIVSVVQVIIIWLIMFSMHLAVTHVGIGIFMAWPVIVAVAWTIPFGILIWFLRRKDIVANFR